MTDVSHRISDEDLQAYIDGQLPAARRAAIARRLANDAEAAAKAEHYRFQADGLRALFDHHLDREVPQRFRRILYPVDELRPHGLSPTGPDDKRHRWRNAWRRYAATAAGVTVLLSISAVGGWLGHSRYMETINAEAQVQSFINQAYSAYHLYAGTGDREPVSEDSLSAVLATLRDTLGENLDPPRSQAALQLVNTRIIPVSGGIGAIFQYRDDQDRIISLYVQPNWDDTRQYYNLVERNDVAFQYRTDGQLAYVLAIPSGMEEIPRAETLLGLSE